MNYVKALVSAILAGMCIGMGGVVYLSVDSKLTGAFFFTVGLFVICAFELNLYTGKVCYVFQNDLEYLLRIPVIWFGNLIGTSITAGLILLTRYGAAISEKAAALCEAKTADNFLSLFVLGIFCDIFIYIGVEGYGKISHETGKYLALFFGVMVFILSGYEHCIADMFYVSAAGMWSGDMLVRILVITLGNAVGGIFFPVVRGWLSKNN